MKNHQTRNIILISLIIPALIVGLIIYLFTIKPVQDEVFIRKSAQAIHLSSEYKQVKSKYVDLRCLDICANLIVIYERNDGAPVTVNPFKALLTSSGYTALPQSFDGDTTYGFTKKIDGGTSKVELWTLPEDSSRFDSPETQVVFEFRRE